MNVAVAVALAVAGTVAVAHVCLFVYFVDFLFMLYPPPPSSTNKTPYHPQGGLIYSKTYSLPDIARHN